MNDRDRIKSVILETVHYCYNLAEDSGGREPMLTVSLLREMVGDSAELPAAYLMSTRRVREAAIRYALETLVREGKLESSLTVGERGEVRAWSPAVSS